MMKLPKVYANPIDKVIDNVQSVYYDRNQVVGFDAERFVRDLYNSDRIVYLIDFRFILDGEDFEDRIASYGKDYILTKRNRKIFYRDIRGIEEIKKV